MSDWNPNYSVTVERFTTNLDLSNSDTVKVEVLKLLDDIDDSKNYKKHYFPSDNQIKIFLKGGSSVVVDINTGRGMAEYLKRRPVFYETNYLHYNPNRLWTWFSDAFAAALILFAITSFFMVKGKHGITGRGGIYTVIGIVLPLLFLLWYL